MSEIDKSYNSKKLVMRSIGFAKPFIGLYALSVFLNIIFSALTGISLALIKPVIEVITTGKITITHSKSGGFLETLKDNFFNWVQNIIINNTDIYSTLINLSAMVILLFLLKNIFKYWGSVTNSYLEEGIVKHIRDTLFKKLTDLSIEFYTKSKSGTIISVLTNDVSVVNGTIISLMSQLIRDITQIVIFILILIAVSPSLTLISFSTSIISFGLLRIGLKYLRKYASRMQTAMADFTTVIQETLSGIRVVKGYNAEDEASRRFSGQTKRFVSSAVKYQKIIAIIPSVNELFAIVALCVVFFVGGSKVITGEMRGDDLFLFLVSLFSVMSPIGTVFHNISQFQRGIVASERIFNVLDHETTVQTGDIKIEKFNDKIEVKGVTFAYDTTEVVKNADIVINKTKKIALVGASGSGKSTMLDLLIRFYDPTEGEILLDGINIKDYEIKSYRKLFGIVSQETMLFNDTITNNIRYGFEDASMEQIIEASKIANAYNFISQLPNGFDTIIGDRGVMLSGGERQRIAIARALIRNPYILIFDEATSALDAESEKIVQGAITESLKERTAIIVAHRLATIIDCDEILVFDGGYIVERGNHKQLLAQDGIYKKLYEIQFSSKVPVNS